MSSGTGHRREATSSQISGMAAGGEAALRNARIRDTNRSLLNIKPFNVRSKASRLLEKRKKLSKNSRSGGRLVMYTGIVSILILALACLASYLNYLPGRFWNLEETDIDYVVCSGYPPSKSCVPAELIDKSLELTREMLKYFTDLGSDGSYNPEGPTLTFTMKQLFNRMGVETPVSSDIVQAVEHLVLKNPHWNIIMERPLGGCEDHPEDECLENINELVKLIYYDKTSKWKYDLKRKYRLFLRVSSVLFSTIACGGCAFFFYRYRKNFQMRKKQIVSDYATALRKELLKTLGEELEVQGSSEVILNHLKDRIVFMKTQSNLLLWNQAVEILEQDPNFTFRTTTLNGEIYKTVMWAPDIKKYIETVFGSRWQAKPESLEMHCEPRTTCLKIKNMFTKELVDYPTLEENIYKALLIKTAGHCKIADIKIDRKNLSVYVRCVTERDAYALHNEIGCRYYEGRLITVKYVDPVKYDRRRSSSSHA